MDKAQTESIAFIVEAVSTKNSGIRSADYSLGKQGWFNYAGADPLGTQNTLRGIQKGQLVELLVINGNQFTSIVNVQDGPEEPAPKVEHTERGKKAAVGFLEDYVTFEELLEKLHKETSGRYSIETKILNLDMEKKFCVVQSHVRGEFGEVERETLVGEKTVKHKSPNARWATGHGDCDQSNGGMVKEHFIRMAETRATARALRSVLGIGKTASEELTPK